MAGDGLLDIEEGLYFVGVLQRQAGDGIALLIG
jgi:hypothetical protein